MAYIELYRSVPKDSLSESDIIFAFGEFTAGRHAPSSIRRSIRDFGQGNVARLILRIIGNGAEIKLSDF